MAGGVGSVRIGVFISIKWYKASDLNRAEGEGFGYLELYCLGITLAL